MPNWCDNEVTVIGTKNVLVELLDQVKDGEECLSFEKILPTEDHENWYLEHIEKWGTKWEVSEPTVTDIEDNGDGFYKILFLFQTAWSPSTPISSELSERFDVKVIHFYDEPGMDFSGLETFFKGRRNVIYEGSSQLSAYMRYEDDDEGEVLQETSSTL